MNSSRLLQEYIVKGIGLSFLAALAFETPDWLSTGLFFAVTGFALAVVLSLAAYRKLREGYRVRGRLLAFVVFLLFENTTLIYRGLLFGMLVGLYLQAELHGEEWWHPLAALAGGVVLGGLFWLLRQVQHQWLRRGAVLVLAAAGTAGIIYWLETVPDLFEGSRRYVLGVQVLLAIPVLYLLTLAGQAEETELEIGAMCAALGVGLWMLLPKGVRLLALLLPPAIYFVYTGRVLKGLRVFKHVLRGMSYNNLGRRREALLAYRRALELDPKNNLAREGRWRVHKDMDLTEAVHDPELMALVDLDLCLGRATELLTQSGPGPERLEEAHKLLNLVLDQRPMMQPAVYYWRAVAHTHAKEFDKAELELRAVLDGADYPPDDPYRLSVLIPCWQLVLLQHPDLKRRIGAPLLTTERRRMEAIAVVERQLARTPDDAAARELKRFLYDDLTEADYQGRKDSEGRVPTGEFDYEYCLQLGQTLLGDGAGWRRGAEFLRIAAEGLPGKGPSIHFQIAQTCRNAGDDDAGRYHFEMVKLLAREVGVKNLAAEDRKAYFTTVKHLGETAYAAGDVDKAIENLTLYTESEQSGIDTLRLLTELHEKKGDALGALHANEKALLYDAKNKHLLERKDRYYYSITVPELEARLDLVRKSFDVGYCTHKARTLLDWKGGGAEQADWALHLAELALVVQPGNIPALTLSARARLRRGEESDAIPLLEEARAGKPERFSSGEEEESWYVATRLLGDLYLQTLGRPDQALQCFADYRKHPKSGADTLYKMGLAYEQLGDRVKAAKCYQHVTVYSEHPLAPDAYMALQRLETK